MSLQEPVEIGIEEGACCNRGWLQSCKGVLLYTEVENCSCHLGHAPCPSCTSVYLYCPECDWSEPDEEGYQAP